MFSDAVTMDFESYCRLSVACNENPAFKPLNAIAYYLAIIHGMMEEEPEVFKQTAEIVKIKAEKLLSKCPDCGRPLLSVVDK